MIKIGIRNNLLYPSIFSVTVVSQRIIIILLRELFDDFEGAFIFVFMKFFFESIIGGLFSIFFSNFPKSEQIKQENRIILIQNKENIHRPDSEKKIFFLMTLAALIEFIGANSRRYVIKPLDHEEAHLMDIRLRSFEIITSSLLSNYFLKTKIYKHQFVSLIIIGISLIFALIIEFIYIDLKYAVIGLVVLLISTLANSTIDIIEKYLFDINFVDIFKLTTFEAVINTLICLPLFSIKTFRSDVYELFKYPFNEEFCIIIYLLIYAILCGFKSIYRRKTLIQYSPNSRALAESISDPFFIVYSSFIKKPHQLTHSIIIFILSIIIDFCACVYNELLVIYCCGLEHEAYLEVNKRGIISNINDIYRDSISIDEEEEKENI